MIWYIRHRSKKSQLASQKHHNDPFSPAPPYHDGRKLRSLPGLHEADEKSINEVDGVVRYELGDRHQKDPRAVELA